MKTINLTLFLTFITSFVFAQNLQITGQDEVCQGDCVTYQVTGGNGYYIWSSTGNQAGNITGDEIEICWFSSGVNRVTVIDLLSPTVNNEEASLDINVNAKGSPEILNNEFIGCTQPDSLNNGITGENELEIECFTYCINTSTTYHIKGYNPNHSYSWEIENGIIEGSTNNTITVTWNSQDKAKIKLYESNGTCLDSVEHCIITTEASIVNAVANQTPGNATTSICNNQSINFQAYNQGNITEFEWYVDGQTYYTQEINHEFTTPGTYTVMLIGYSDCNCADTSFHEVIVDTQSSPIIDCVSTICSGDTATYYASEICDTYQWTVGSEGVIVDGGNTDEDYISIVWNSGPTSSVTLQTDNCNGSTCAFPTIAQIPIIDGTAGINGPQKVCRDEVTSYTIQNYPGTNYIWTLSQNGQIIDGQGSNSIKIRWTDDYWVNNPTALLSVDYDNCFLGCGGNAQLAIDISDRFEINGSEILCAGQNTYFGSNFFTPGFTADWTLIDENGIETTFANVSYINPVISNPGHYTIEAYDVNDIACNSLETFEFDVITPDPLPDTILGPKTICKDKFYNYYIPGMDNETTATWYVSDGSSTKYFNGNQIGVEFESNGPYSIRVRFNKVCFLGEKSINLRPISSLEIEEEGDACAGSYQVYSIDALPDEDMDWQINPPNAGSITQITSNQIEVFWNQDGVFQLSATYCNENISKNITVVPFPAINVTYDEEVCPDGLSEVITALSGSEEVYIYDEMGNLAANGSPAYVPPGIYDLTFINANGCEKTKVIAIDTTGVGDIRISSPELNFLCLPAPPIEIAALETEDGYTYQWYKNNVLLPGEVNSTTYQNDLATYHVEVSTADGCLLISNEFTIFNGCNPGGSAGTCIANPDNIGKVNLNCNNKEYYILPPVGSIGYQWYFDLQSSNEFEIGTSTITHEFDKAGYYMIGAIGIDDNIGTYIIDTIPAVADFIYRSSCISDSVRFINLSTFLPQYNIINYSWNFGDIGSGIDNTSSLANPKHLFTSPGIYDVTLEIESDYGCLSEKTIQIEVRDIPQVDFETKGGLCYDQTIKFIPEETQYASMMWDFGEPASGIANTSEETYPAHSYQSAGMYTVSLTVEDIYGCSNTISKNITISAPLLSGDITADLPNPVCYGNDVLLTAPAGGSQYYWSNGATTQSITVSDKGIYSVQIIDNNGCLYSPEPYSVIYSRNLDLSIIGYLEDDFNFSSKDSMEVCIDENFYLRATYVFNATYEWSVGNSTTYYSYKNDLINDLVLGENIINVKITDTDLGCEYIIPPFKLILRDFDQPINISSAPAQSCEGELTTLTIDNFDSSNTYFWSNGQTGNQIEVKRAGTYFVEGYNQYGCSQRSNTITVYGAPNMNGVLSGCITTCFPDTLCLSKIPNGYTYQWLLDGSPLGTPAFTADLIINDPGAYQLISSNVYGCSDTSEVLQIDPEPSMQRLDGIAFNDLNGNGIFDGSDVLISGATIELLNGATIVDNTTTDTNGYYNFDNITFTNVSVRIDTTGLDLQLPPEALQYQVNFLTCNDEREQDFPLYDSCLPVYRSYTYEVCKGETILVNGIEYSAPYSLEDTLNNVDGCDSIVSLTVNEYQDIYFAAFTEPSCENTDNGGFEFWYYYSTVDSIVMNNTVTLDTNFINDLSPGFYSFTVYDHNGCSFEISDSIVESIMPALELETTESCVTATSGELIIHNGNPNLFYSLDNFNYSTDTIFSNLPATLQTLYVTDANGCSYEYPFTIDPFTAPQIDIFTTETCENSSNGSVEVNPVSPGNYTYSLDGINFSNQNVFDSLDAGTYILEMMVDNECSFMFQFTINEYQAPDVLINIVSSCPGMDNGIMEVINPSNNLSFSLDGTTFDTTTLYDNLSPGNYLLLLQDDGFCEYPLPFVVDETVAPSIDVITTESCLNEANGSIEILPSPSSLSFSVDNATFSASTNYTDLDTGVHNIIIEDENGCFFEEEFYINVAPEMEVIFEDPILDCSINQVSLAPEIITATGDISYLWSTGSTDSLLSVTNNGNYEVEVEDNCTTRAYEYEVEFIEVSAEAPIYVPNIFSPNQDGTNDCFVLTPDKNASILSYELLIFDRWGNKMYESNDYNDCWDGFFHNKIVRSGVFVYMLNVEYTYCEEIETYQKVGDVTVIY